MDIKVLDEVFDLDVQNILYNVCKEASYHIGWGDSSDIELNNRPFFHAKGDINSELAKKLDLSIKNNFFNSELTNFKLNTMVINCSRPGETYWVHTHGNNTKIVLYYSNFKWDKEWGGETLFYDEKGNNLIFASEYRPNRMVFFDGKIPHSVRAPTYIADQYRFTMSFFYTKIQ